MKAFAVFACLLACASLGEQHVCAPSLFPLAARAPPPRIALCMPG